MSGHLRLTRNMKAGGYHRRTRRGAGSSAPRRRRMACALALPLCLCSVALLVPGGALAQPGPASTAKAPAEGAVWFYLDGNNEQGPVTAAAVRELFEAGKVNASTRVRHRGPHNWTPLEQQEAFLDLTGWHYALDGKDKGPVSEGALRELVARGTVSRTTLIWRPGMARWTALSSVARFNKAGEAEASVVRVAAPPPPPVDAASPPSKKPVARPRVKGKVVGQRRERNRRLWLPGSIILGVTWGGSIAVSILMALVQKDGGCHGCGDFAETLWIPLVGPIVADQVNQPDKATRTAFMVVLSLGQAAGAGLLIAGLVGKKVPIYAKVEKAAGLSGLTVTPLVGRINGVGLSAYW